MFTKYYNDKPQATYSQAPTDQKIERGRPSFIYFWVTTRMRCAWERESGACEKRRCAWSDVGMSGDEVRWMWSEGGGVEM